MPRQRERERDGRIQVSAGQMTGRGDNDHDHQSESRGVAECSERLAALRVDHDRAAAGEDQNQRRAPP